MTGEGKDDLDPETVSWGYSLHREWSPKGHGAKEKVEHLRGGTY